MKFLCAAAELKAPISYPLKRDYVLRDFERSAIAAGVFGAPFFIVDGEPFWGNDRQAQIAQWLRSGPFKGMV